jgi:predicted DNA binding CopG/RHH family protein
MMNTPKNMASPKKMTMTPSRAKKNGDMGDADYLSSPAGREETHKRFMDAAKNGTLRQGIPPVALTALAAAGRTVSINIRISAADVQKAHELAREKGVGYQTVIKMLLHEALKKNPTHMAGGSSNGSV